MVSTASLVVHHILHHLARTSRNKTQAPLFVALQGPQGSGKTYLTRTVTAILSSPPHSLHVAVLSVDDLYLTHDGLVNLSHSHPMNKLWNGRGLPGTHDITLGVDVLARLHAINSDSGIEVTLPSFDKSKFSGEGDRAVETTTVSAPLDVVLLEGWCLGFYPLGTDQLDAKWENVCAEAEYAPESIVARAMDGIRKEDIIAVNEALRAYVREWYRFFELFIQICCPAESPYEHIYTVSLRTTPYKLAYPVRQWRLQQEHNMKVSNGGIGMTDEQVKRFVDRYIPGYVFFGEGVQRGGSVEGRPPWEGKGLRVTINRERQVIDTEHF